MHLVAVCGERLLRVTLADSDHLVPDGLPAVIFTGLATRSAGAKIADGLDFFLDWNSTAYSWVLLPSGQRIALELDQLVLLDKLPPGFEQAIQETEKDWACQYLLSGADGSELKAALILAVRYRLAPVSPALKSLLGKYSRDKFGYGSNCCELPEGHMVCSQGPIPLLKLVLHFLGRKPAYCNSYHIARGPRLPKTPCPLSYLERQQSPREVLQRFGCPDWIDLGNGEVWDFYQPHSEEFRVVRTTVEWDGDAKMRSLATVIMLHEEVLERANLMLVRTMLASREPLRIVSIHP